MLIAPRFVVSENESVGFQVVLCGQVGGVCLSQWPQPSGRAEQTGSSSVLRLTEQHPCPTKEQPNWKPED